MIDNNACTASPQVVPAGNRCIIDEPSFNFFCCEKSTQQPFGNRIFTCKEASKVSPSLFAIRFWFDWADANATTRLSLAFFFFFKKIDKWSEKSRREVFYCSFGTRSRLQRLLNNKKKPEIRNQYSFFFSGDTFEEEESVSKVLASGIDMFLLYVWITSITRANDLSSALFFFCLDIW